MNCLFPPSTEQTMFPLTNGIECETSWLLAKASWRLISQGPLIIWDGSQSRLRLGSRIVLKPRPASPDWLTLQLVIHHSRSASFCENWPNLLGTPVRLKWKFQHFRTQVSRWWPPVAWKCGVSKDGDTRFQALDYVYAHNHCFFFSLILSQFQTPLQQTMMDMKMDGPALACWSSWTTSLRTGDDVHIYWRHLGQRIRRKIFTSIRTVDMKEDIHVSALDYR
jgi:hypothetical protein